MDYLFSDLDDELFLESSQPEVLNEGMFEKYNRRPLNRSESSRLKVPKDELHCSVMYFTKKKDGSPVGYAAFTHRCFSGFYDSPEDIPAKKLHFVSSTS